MPCNLNGKRSVTQMSAIGNRRRRAVARSFALALGVAVVAAAMPARADGHWGHGGWGHGGWGHGGWGHGGWGRGGWEHGGWWGGWGGPAVVVAPPVVAVAPPVVMAPPPVMVVPPVVVPPSINFFFR